MKIIFYFLIVGSALSASALEGVQRNSTQLPFHKHIDAASEQQQQLKNQMDHLYKAPAPEQPQRRYREEGIIADFIESEVHFGGKQKAVVDRRVNAVESAPTE